MKYLRKFLCTSYLEQKTNNWVLSKINFPEGPREPLQATVKRQKLALFRHVTCQNSLSKTILQGTLGGQVLPWSTEDMLDGQCQKVDMPMQELLTRASCRKDWNRVSAKSSLVPPLVTQSIKGLK